jgi:hypothetical protein
MKIDSNRLAKYLRENLDSLSPELRRELAEASKNSTKRKCGIGTVVAYYHEKFARELMPYLDLLAQQEGTHTGMFISAREHKTSPKTLHLKISQAWMYLRDYLDPTGKYVELKNKITIRREDMLGVKLVWKDKPVRPLPKPQLVKPDPDAMNNWKEGLQEYLETAIDNQKFDREGLNLRDEDMTYVRNLVSMMGSGFHIIKLTHNRIFILKKTNFTS